MRLYYRYDNIVRDILAQDELTGRYHGIIIPATIAIYYKNSVSTFLENYPNPYFIDPMTYFINQAAKNICNTQNNARRSYKKLIQEYLDLDTENINDLHLEEESFWNLSGRDFEIFCRNVLNFQRECFQDPEMIEFMNEYLEEDEQYQECLPELLITPYVLIEDHETYDFNRRCIETAFRIYDGDIPLYACITISKEFLRNTSHLEDQIMEDFTFVNNFILWISDFNAINEPIENLTRLKNIIRTMSENGSNKIINLYGDYFSLILSKIGLNGFSSGLRGGTKKRAKLYKGGGGRAATNVYVPQLRRFLLEDEFRTEIQNDERLICNCRKCEEINNILIQDDPMYPEVFANYLMEEKNYLVHFLLCRNEENLNLEELNLQELLDDLREKSEQYNTSHFIDHLLRWLEDL